MLSFRKREENGPARPYRTPALTIIAVSSPRALCMYSSPISSWNDVEWMHASVSRGQIWRWGRCWISFQPPGILADFCFLPKDIYNLGVLSFNWSGCFVENYLFFYSLSKKKILTKIRCDIFYYNEFKIRYVQNYSTKMCHIQY